MDLRGIFKNSDNILEFPTGTVIFTEGTPGDVMYIILDGEVEVRTGNNVVQVVGPGDVVGEMALIDSKPRSASAVAKSGCRLVPVDEKRFLFVVNQTPFFSLHIMRILVDRLRNMNSLRNA